MAEIDQAPLIDLSDIPLSYLIKEVDTDTSEPVRRAVARIIHDLQDPNGVISAFGSFAGT